MRRVPDHPHHLTAVSTDRGETDEDRSSGRCHDHRRGSQDAEQRQGASHPAIKATRAPPPPPEPGREKGASRECTRPDPSPTRHGPGNGQSARPRKTKSRKPSTTDERRLAAQAERAGRPRAPPLTELNEPVSRCVCRSKLTRMTFPRGMLALVGALHVRQMTTRLNSKISAILRGYEL